MSNTNLISVFEKLIQGKQKEITKLKEDKVKNKKEISQITFKIINFRKALGIIKEYPQKINKGEDIKHIKGIGKGIITRIDEIIKEGTLGDEIKEEEGASLEYIQQQELETITGIGPSKANELFKKKVTLDNLLKEMKKIKGDFSKIQEEDMLSNLTHHQLIGVKYFKDIDEKIPRDEIKSIKLKLNKFIKQLNKNYEVHICGSFRRKKETSGDIDVLILHQQIMTHEQINGLEDNILTDIISYLTEKKLLVDHLTEDGKTKYMGICKLNSKRLGRRIDIRFIPYESKAAAILYFTGSGNFNKHMRTEALKQGYTINEYGIYKTKKVNGKQVKDRKILTSTEKDIFDIVKMKYLEPENRV